MDVRVLQYPEDAEQDPRLGANAQYVPDNLIGQVTAIYTSNGNESLQLTFDDGCGVGTGMESLSFNLRGGVVDS